MGQGGGKLLHDVYCIKHQYTDTFSNLQLPKNLFDAHHGRVVVRRFFRSKWFAMCRQITGQRATTARNFHSRSHRPETNRNTDLLQDHHRALFILRLLKVPHKGVIVNIVKLCTVCLQESAIAPTTQPAPWAVRFKEGLRRDGAVLCSPPSISEAGLFCHGFATGVVGVAANEGAFIA